MRPGRRAVAIVLAVLALVATPAAATSCGGDETTTTVAPPTTTLATTTSGVPATASETADLDGIRSALEASGNVADDFEIADHIIMQEWAGAVVSAPMVDDARVLLKKGDAGGRWSRSSPRCRGRSCSTLEHQRR